MQTNNEKLRSLESKMDDMIKQAQITLEIFLNDSSKLNELALTNVRKEMREFIASCDKFIEECGKQNSSC